MMRGTDVRLVLGDGGPAMYCAGRGRGEVVDPLAGSTMETRQIEWWDETGRAIMTLLGGREWVAD